MCDFGLSGVFDADVPGGSPVDQAAPAAPAADGGWRASPSMVSGAGLQPTVMPWSSADFSQQDPTTQTLTYPATDVYMPTLCPSYTMLTYTHAPLLANFGVSRR